MLKNQLILTAGPSITKKEISQTCQISEVTISKCYKNLHLYQEHILPKEILLKLYPE